MQDQRNGSAAAYAWTRSSRRQNPRESRFQCHVQPGARTAWHTHPLGQALIITAGIAPRAALGRACGRGPSRRCGLVPARRKTLARRRADHGHDAHSGSGSARRQGGRMDGKGQRRTVSDYVKSLTGHNPAVVSEVGYMDTYQALNAQQRSVIPIAAFTATGDMEKLKQP